MEEIVFIVSRSEKLQGNNQNLESSYLWLIWFYNLYFLILSKFLYFIIWRNIIFNLEYNDKVILSKAFLFSLSFYYPSIFTYSEDHGEHVQIRYSLFRILGPWRKSPGTSNSRRSDKFHFTIDFFSCCISFTLYLPQATLIMDFMSSYKFNIWPQLSLKQAHVTNTTFLQKSCVLIYLRKHT